MPKKFENLVEELKKGNCEIVDFSNAELGDAFLKLVFELLPTNPKIK